MSNSSGTLGLQPTRLLHHGAARLVEFDNPDAIFLRNGKSHPILRNEVMIAGKKVREARLQFEPGDICVLISDGVIHAGVGKLLNLGWQLDNVVDYLEKAYKKDITAYSLQNLLLCACDNLYMQEPGDDTTVAVFKVRIPNVAYVMVGPPVDSREDEELVNRLLTFQGTKIVCGGTTSQIVSRVSGRELTSVLNYVCPDVPPIGSIKGVDLVTEGVITLGKTLELLKRYESGAVGRENCLNYRNDGASLMAQTFVNKCTGVRFVVGRALNPAHQNPNMPINLSIKLRLVQEIADCLKRLDKEVEIEYH